MSRNVTVTEIYSAYKKWVINNPTLVTDVETVATWSSYFIAGKINKSAVVSELVYAVSKLVSLFNDRVIREASEGRAPCGLREQLRLCLTVVHYTEVLLELAIRSRWGERAKWTAAALLQLFKCCSALVLLYRFEEAPVSHPPIPALQRKKFTRDRPVAEETSESFFTLRRSGRVMRRVDGAPSVAFRDWQPALGGDERPARAVRIEDISYAECLHIVKPLVHLAAMRAFGTRAWKQWLLALAFDIASMRLYNGHLNDLTYDQRLEVSRRKLSLALYLLRSPLYNGYSKNVIESILKSVSSKIPLLQVVSAPLLHHLNQWQSMYFYMWSS